MNDDDWKKYLQPDQQLPEWQPMGEQESPNIPPFVDALKKRMSKPQTGEMSYSEMLGGGAKSGSGGMKSL